MGIDIAAGLADKAACRKDALYIELPPEWSPDDPNHDTGPSINLRPFRGIMDIDTAAAVVTESRLLSKRNKGGLYVNVLQQGRVPNTEGSDRFDSEINDVNSDVMPNDEFSEDNDGALQTPDVSTLLIPQFGSFPPSKSMRSIYAAPFDRIRTHSAKNSSQPNIATTTDNCKTVPHSAVSGCVKPNTKQAVTSNPYSHGPAQVHAFQCPDHDDAVHGMKGPSLCVPMYTTIPGASFVPHTPHACLPHMQEWSNKHKPPSANWSMLAGLPGSPGCPSNFLPPGTVMMPAMLYQQNQQPVAHNLTFPAPQLAGAQAVKSTTKGSGHCHRPNPSQAVNRQYFMQPTPNNPQAVPVQHNSLQPTQLPLHGDIPGPTEDGIAANSTFSYDVQLNTVSGTLIEQSVVGDTLKPMPAAYAYYPGGCHQGNCNAYGKSGLSMRTTLTPMRSMCGLMKRHVLVESVFDNSCQAIEGLCRSNLQAAKKYYKELYYKCRDLDVRVERTDVSSSGMSNDWHNFCLSCNRLSLLDHGLYRRLSQSAHIYYEEHVAYTEQQLRSYGKEKIGQIGYYDINTMCVQPDACYTIWLGRLLQWNKAVMIPGDHLIEYSITAWNLCEGDISVAEAVYRKLYKKCMELDEQVVPFDAYPNGNPDKWKEFCHKSTRLLLLRQAFLEIYDHDPCVLVPPTDNEDEEEHRIPAPRKLVTRLQPVKPQVARNGDSKGILWLQIINTPANVEGCLCIVNDTAFSVFDTAVTKLKGAYLAGEPLTALSKQCEILAEDRFLLDITGVLPDGSVYLPMSGRNMIQAYRQAHCVSYPAGSRAAGQFLVRLRATIQEYDVQNLADLVRIGVDNAVHKLQQFQMLCALYISVKQLSFGQPVVLNLGMSLYPGISQRLMALLSSYQQQHDIDRVPHDMSRMRKQASLNLASIPTLADALFADWDYSKGLYSELFQM